MKYDGLLFDMDGTLWDAVDSYCAVWNATIDALCPSVMHIDRATLCSMMGLPLEVIFGRIIGDAYPYEAFMEGLLANEARIMPVMGGVLYPGVRDTLKMLSDRHRLYMVSNCTPDGLPNFLEFTGLGEYITDGISYGDNGLEKDRNIAIMVERHGLKSPLYIGDTAGDCRAAHAAGVPFVWARYGFGHNVGDAEYVIDDIMELLDIVGI